jgi:hypothetical protein
MIPLVGATPRFSAFLDVRKRVGDNAQMGPGRPSAFVFFKCPNCKALYQLIKVEAGPESVDRQITCVLCGALFPGREGGFVPKYILLR